MWWHRKLGGGSRGCREAWSKRLSIKKVHSDPSSPPHGFQLGPGSPKAGNCTEAGERNYAPTAVPWTQSANYWRAAPSINSQRRDLGPEAEVQKCAQYPGQACPASAEASRSEKYGR